jgi:hypothetical protein
MPARLDNLPQRHRSVTLHTAAPEVDFRTSMRCERIPGRHEPRSRNFSFHACHAKPRPLAYRLRKLRELQDPGSGRPALGLEIGITLAETAETPAMARPPDTATDSRAGRKGRKGRKPIFSVPLAVRKYSWGPLGGKMARPSSSSTARRQFRGSTGIGGRGFYGAHLLREAVAKPREQSENSQSFQCGKAANPGQWCLLIPAFCVPKF